MMVENVACPCGTGVLRRQTAFPSGAEDDPGIAGGFQYWRCDEADHIYLRLDHLEDGRCHFTRWHSHPEIVFGLFAAIPPSTSAAMSFRLWLSPGTPREELLSAVVEVLDHTSLTKENHTLKPSRSGYGSGYALSNEQVVRLSLLNMGSTTPLLHGAVGRDSVRFGFSGRWDLESEISGQVSGVTERELLDRLARVLDMTGGLYATISKGYAIEARVSALLGLSDQQLGPKAFPFGVGPAGLPGLGRFGVFGPALVRHIGVETFEQYDGAKQQGRCWTVAGALTLAEAESEVPGPNEQAAIHALGAQYFLNHGKPWHRAYLKADGRYSAYASNEVEPLLIDQLGHAYRYFGEVASAPSSSLGPTTAEYPVFIQRPMRFSRHPPAFELVMPDSSRRDATGEPELDYAIAWRAAGSPRARLDDGTPATD